MGKVEKVIVLSVLFLIALILVVSLTVEAPFDKNTVAEAGGAPPPSTTIPLVPDASRPTQPEATPVPGPVTPAPALLSSNIEPTPAPVVPAPQPATAVPPAPAPVAAPTLPPGALLKKLDGLTDSILPDMKRYTWKEGDSYAVVAQAYYGSAQKQSVLKRSNEGRADVKPGETIFLPVFDTDATLVDRSRGSSAERAGSKSSAPAASSGRVHVVADGESLWKIAKKELGNGDRWREIYELNRDVLAKPEAVHKGQRLRLP